MRDLGLWATRVNRRLPAPRAKRWLIVSAWKRGVPPQNLVDRAMIDVSALRGFGARSFTPMLHLLYALLTDTRSSLRSQRELALEDLALRQQLAVLKHETKRPNAD